MVGVAQTRPAWRLASASRRHPRGATTAAAVLLAVLVLELAVAQQQTDHYKVLGVKKDAKDREIKKAYHKLALKHHPDKSADCKKSQESNQCKRANRVFMKISRAYETLSDPEKRRYYDQVAVHASAPPVVRAARCALLCRATRGC